MDDNLLTKTAIFQNISNNEVKSMLECLRAVTRQYQKGETIYRIGDVISDMGLVLSGSIHIEQNDIWGNRRILEYIGSGQVFAETYACIPNEPLMVNAIAAKDTEVLFLNAEKLLTTCPSTCSFHTRVIRNLLSISAQKNLSLTRKIFHTSPKSIREKLLSYLSFQAIRQGTYQFDIPFNRQQLADYLGVDRSALSNELSKMQRDGLLRFHKNRFCLTKE